MLPSTGTVGDSYDNAMAESVNGAYKTELVWRRKLFQDLRDLELATFRWVSWRGLEASAPVLGLQDTGTDRNRVLCKPSGASRPTIRAEQKSGHITETLLLPGRTGFDRSGGVIVLVLISFIMLSLFRHTCLAW